MLKPLSLLVVVSLTLSACGWRDSRVNPSNWFGGSRSTPVEAPPADEANALIPQERQGGGLFARPEEEDTSVPIAKVDELRIEPIPSGAIVYASGTAIRQGAFDARLVRVESEENQKNGILEYTFRVDYPKTQTPQGSERTRMVSDAINVSTQELEGIRLVRVVGQQNALESRRR